MISQDRAAHGSQSARLSPRPVSTNTERAPGAAPTSPQARLLWEAGPTLQDPELTHKTCPTPTSLCKGARAPASSRAAWIGLHCCHEQRGRGPRRPHGNHAASTSTLVARGPAGEARPRVPRMGSKGALGQTNADKLEKMENIKSFLWQESQEQAEQSEEGSSPALELRSSWSKLGGRGGSRHQQLGPGNPYVRACRTLTGATGPELQVGAGNGLSSAG